MPSVTYTRSRFEITVEALERQVPPRPRLGTPVVFVAVFVAIFGGALTLILGPEGLGLTLLPAIFLLPWLPRRDRATGHDSTSFLWLDINPLRRL